MGNDIGSMLKKAREQRELSISKLASVSGLAESTLRQIEQGKHYPSLKTLFKLERYINIDIGTGLGYHISEFISHAQARFLEDYFGEHYQYVYYNPKSTPAYFYCRGFVWIDIASIDEEYLKAITMIKAINGTTKLTKQLEDDNDYESIFDYFEKKGALFRLFICNYSTIPIEQRYSIFRSIYIISEYSFKLLPSEFLESVFTTREYSNEWSQDIRKLESKADSEGYITIYRGESSKSSPLKRAWSWTLSYETARFFATRFSKKGMVYEARIAIKDVYDYMLDRREDEVLVHPKDIFNYTKTVIVKNIDD